MTLTDARLALLSRLIDHAPLFPPAALELPEALAEDRRARESDASWMLGRFVCPAARVAELGVEERALSVVATGREEVPDDARIESIETRSDDWQALAGLGVEVYVELPADHGLEQRLDALAHDRLRAKVRCGGERAPSTEELARFVRSCRARGVVFKATAGLHQAVRRGSDHGFLNLLAACVFGDEEAALADEDPTAFRLDHGSFRWRGRAAGPEELATVRRVLFHSIGSCSFFEPVDELRRLGALPQ
jgi:hypothetical protein